MTNKKRSLQSGKRRRSGRLWFGARTAAPSSPLQGQREKEGSTISLHDNSKVGNARPRHNKTGGATGEGGRGTRGGMQMALGAG